MSEPLVSIIVPVFKVEPYLRRCLDSIINQTYSNLEIILVDDGSPDNCPQICDEYAAKDDRIIVIHKENGGLSEARNVGLDICKGDYISFIDSDDWVDENYIEVLLKKIIDTQSDISIVNHQTFSYTINYFAIDDLKEGVFPNEEIIEQIFTTRNQYKIAWGKLFKKRLFSTLRFPHATIHEDEFIGFIPYFYAKKIVCTNLPLYHYLKRNDSITGAEQNYDYFESKLEQIRFLVENSHPDLADRLSTSMSKYYLNRYFIERKQRFNEVDYKKNIHCLRRILPLFSIKKKNTFFYRALTFACNHTLLYLVYKNIARFFQNPFQNKP